MYQIVLDNLSCNSSYAGFLGAGRINAFNAVSTSSSCTDSDGDGHTDAACGGTDCDDADINVNPEDDILYELFYRSQDI